MKFLNKAAIRIALILALSASGQMLHAQGIVNQALSWLPSETTALEYANLSSLRSLPNYSSLRARYLGTNLQALETSLGRLGIHESDLSAIVLAWRANNGKSQYGGIAEGQFDPAMVAQSAETAHMRSQVIQGTKAFCISPDPQATCVAVLDDTTGLFGPALYLDRILAARAGKSPNLTQNAQFSHSLLTAQSDASGAPIWGVAVGPAAAKWLGAWMPGEKNLQMNWASAFKNVEAVTYNIEAGDDVTLSLKLECNSTNAASSVLQLFQGLKLLQQMAWHSTNPNTPNPFQSLQVESDNRQVTLHLTADYTALSQMGPLGHP
ncbi:MAG: hypothetical protein ACRD2B_16505 [Terriglobia bacterium]